MFTDRFEIQKKDYSYSAQVNFAECREKVKIDPNATVPGSLRLRHQFSE